MYPYQLSMVMADQRIRDRIAAAERHRLIAAGRRNATDRTEMPSRSSSLTTWVRATFHARRDASLPATGTSARADLSTRTTTSSAGPVGCSA